MKLRAFFICAFGLLAAPSVRASADLNVQAFAHCLALVSPSVDLPAIQSRYHFNDFDLLVFYLAAYPGEKIPGLPVSVQNQANQNWEVRFESQDGKLAQALVISPPRTPEDAFKAATSICSGDVFCAALTTQNVLRTFGRYQNSIVTNSKTGAVADYNPAWFKNNREQWVQRIPELQASMISLRTDGAGDRYGEWYHVFGVLAYAIDEMSQGHEENSVEKIVKLNDLFDRELTGNAEDPVKAQIDEDSVVMSWEFLGGKAQSGENCSSVSAYVN
jgi:hypothetical protein